MLSLACVLDTGKMKIKTDSKRLKKARALQSELTALKMSCCQSG